VSTTDTALTRWNDGATAGFAEAVAAADGAGAADGVDAAAGVELDGGCDSAGCASGLDERLPSRTV
jgi:hypothetical protein